MVYDRLRSRKGDLVRQFSGIARGALGVSLAIAALLVFIVPGCFRQNQDNSPISISNSQGRPMLSVTCSMDGSIAYVADGRNVYRYDRNASGNGESWVCILSHGQRLEMAAKHDPREPLPPEGTPEKTPDAKSGGTGPAGTGK
jgi:hypothetical protein